MAADGSIRVDTRLDNSKAKVGAQDFVNMVNRMTQAANQAGQRMSGSVGDYVTAMNRAKAATRGMAGDQAALAREILKTSDAIRRMEERQELARRKFEAAKEEAVGKAMDKFQRDNAGAEYMPWENEEQALAQLSEDLNRVAQEASDAFGVFEDSSAFTSSETQIEFLRERLAALNTQMAGMGTAGESAAQGVAEVAAAAQGGGWAALGTAIQKGVSGFIRLAGSAAKAALNVAKMAGGAALSFLRRLAAGAKNAAIQLAKLAANALRAGGKAISKGFKGLGSLIGQGAKSLLGFNKASKQSHGGLKQGLMMILRYGLGIRGLFALFRRLRTAVSEGLGEIAKRSPELKSALNSMKAALNGLKSSLATAFTPIVTAVAPALTKLMNMLASAINMIGAFIAALTGQKTYQKAVSGLEATGNAAGGAADQVKELKRQLAGFDQLEILSANDSSSGGGGSGGGGTAGYNYETAEIEGGIVDFVARLKELWANADYEGIGREIAGAINGAFAKAKDLISWDALGDKITEAVDAITGIFNGLVDGIDWKLIGETFGAGVNTLIRTVNLLLTGVDWENLGKSFATGLNGLVNTVNWSEMGELLANRLNALIGVIKGVVENFDFGNAGTKLGEAINSLILSVKWADMGETVANLFNGVLAYVRSAINKVDFGNAGTKLGEAINALILSVDWAGMGSTVANLFNGVLAYVRSAINKVDFGNAGTKLGEAINALILEPDWAGMGTTIANLFNGVLAYVRSAINKVDFGTAGTKLGEAINALLLEPDWAGMGTTVSNLFNGVLAYVRSAINKVEWGNAGAKLGEAISALIMEPDWAGMGTTIANLFNGALAYIRSAINKIDFGDAGTKLGEAISNLVTGVKWSDIGQTIGTLFSGALAYIRNAVNNINFGDAATKLFEAIKGFVTSVNWSDVGDTIATLTGAALAFIRKAINELDFGDSATKLAELLTGFFKKEEIWADAGTIVSDAIKGLFTWGADFLNNLPVTQISDDIKAALGAVDWAGIGSAIFKFLVAAIKAAGSLLWELLTDFPDQDEYEKEIEEWKAGVMGDTEVDLVFGLNPTFPDEGEAIQAINEAIANALETGNYQFPIGLDVPEETVLAAAEEFVREWNNLHPEAPMTVNAETGEVEPLAQKIIDADDRTVTTTEDLAKGKEDASAIKTRDDASGTVTTTEDLAKGKEDASAIKTRDDAGGTVTTTEDLAKGKEDASAIKTRDDKGGTVTTTEDLKKGKEDASAIKTRDDKGGTVTTTEDLKKGKENASAIKTRDDKGGTVTTTENLKKGKEDKSAIKTRDDKGGTVTTTENLKKGKENKSALRSRDAKDHTIETKVSVSKDTKHWSDSSYNLVKTGSDTIKKTVLVSVKPDPSHKKVVVKPSQQGGDVKYEAEWMGGIITNSGAVRRFARGGVISGGLARYLSSVPHYASGTTRAHGTVFVAGEAGPEIMGHINGRTEILNKSQLTQAIYSAVVSGMGRAVNALGSFLSARMGECANAIVETIGNVAAMPDLSGLAFRAPAMASGTVMPYEVAAQVARTGEDIQRTLNANNEDLIQTIISVAGQLVAAVGRIQPGAGPSGAGGGLAARQVIEQINRQTRMFGASPLEGV